MAQDSKVKRRLRRLKRQNTLFLRAIVGLQKERDFYRNAIIEMGKKHDEAAEAPKTPSLTITHIEDELDTPEGAQFAEDHLGVVKDEEANVEGNPAN